MFNKNKFSNILQKINNNYQNMTEFSNKANFDRSYISKYIHKRLDNPPSPKILHNIANASYGLVSYIELMEICGYIDYSTNDIKENLEYELQQFHLTEEEYYGAINCFMNGSETIQGLAFTLKFMPNLENKEINKESQVLTTIMKYVLTFVSDDLCLPNDKETVKNKEKLEVLTEEFYKEFDKALRPAKELLLSLNKEKIISNTFPYTAKDSSMALLLDIGDIAHIYKKNTYENGETILFTLDNVEYIRKIIDYGDCIELCAMNPYYPVFKYTKEELKEKKFSVIGKVISVENSSAFK